MSTINTFITSEFVVPPGSSWNYWFLPVGGQWSPLETVRTERRVMHLIARPWFISSWDIEGDEVTVILNNTGTLYRHAYVLLVKNLHPTNWGLFFIAVSELIP